MDSTFFTFLLRGEVNTKIDIFHHYLYKGQCQDCEQNISLLSHHVHEAIGAGYWLEMKQSVLYMI
jgi:hypothetical protein